MAGRLRAPEQKVRVDSGCAERLLQEFSVRPDFSRVGDPDSGTRTRHRQIQTFTSGKPGIFRTRKGLLGPDKMRNLIHMVNIQRAEIQNVDRIHLRELLGLAVFRDTISVLFHFSNGFPFSLRKEWLRSG